MEMDEKLYYEAGNYDVIVVGAGHAGIEAALAPARMGKKVLVLTISLDAVGLMACNPSIGGTAKGHLVREVDALGGEMGKAIDQVFIQSRMINTSKGPAVHSLRAQADKRQYHIYMKNVLENEPNLTLKQAEVVDLIAEDGSVKGVITRTGAKFYSKAVVLATGTFLGGKIFIGEVHYEAGPQDLMPAKYLTKAMNDKNITTRRFKTGTPARVHRDSIDFEAMEIQPGDEKIVPFSFLSGDLSKEQIPCYLTYTNKNTHEIIQANMHRSPLYTGVIESTGPRYCPSIEDKVVRFADKERHQIFIEPEGLDTKEMYIQGLSSSLPAEVQKRLYQSIRGLENAVIMRDAYAIEYDCIDPTDLKRSLEYKHLENLFCAGQLNGSSGYEEAAAQGIIAGINASLKIDGKESFIIDRSEGYIGVLVDDLTTKGTNEPYRMMTSRSEYRLTLRQDNADLRLTEKSYEAGLASQDRYDRLQQKKIGIKNEIERLSEIRVTPSAENKEKMAGIADSELKKTQPLLDLLKRPELNYESLACFDDERPELDADIIEQVQIKTKYDGYIKKQLKQIEQFKKMESKKLPENINFDDIKGLRIEARQKLDKIRPDSIGQASRISGVSPADVNVLLVYLEQQKRIRTNEEGSTIDDAQ
jgi:tRNA uridine 5-carboxymethylaminomethyl modification enzyme